MDVGTERQRRKVRMKEPEMKRDGGIGRQRKGKKVTDRW